MEFNYLKDTDADQLGNSCQWSVRVWKKDRAKKSIDQLVPSCYGEQIKPDHTNQSVGFRLGAGAGVRTTPRVRPHS